MNTSTGSSSPDGLERRNNASMTTPCAVLPFSTPPSTPATPPREPRWRFMTDTEISEFLSANGSSASVLRDHLSKAGFFTSHSYKGKITKSYRCEYSLNGIRLRVGYIRLWTSAFVALQQPGFNWEEYVVDVLRIPGHQREGWPRLVRELYEKLDTLDLCGILSCARKRWTARFYQGMTPETETTKEPSNLLNTSVPESLNLEIESTEAADPLMEINPMLETIVEADANGEADADETEEAVPEEAETEKKTRYPVLRLFLEDMILGLGMQISKVEKRYQNSDSFHQITLDQKVQLIKKKVTYKLTTHRCYIRTLNLFLLWLNEVEPNLWKDSGILLATHENIYGFLEDYRIGKIRPTGMEPAISQVLNGTATFTQKGSKVPLSAANGAKLISSLTFMFDAQQTLLNVPQVQSLRSFRIFNLWEHNLQYAEADRRHGNTNEKQRNVLATECPLSAKKRQSVHLLLEDTWLSIRNRAMSLCQAFSISRFDELSRWSIADLHAFTYSSELPTVGDQDINVIYVQQPIHKAMRDGRAPDEKLIIRHKDLLLCPLSSLAMMMYERFVQSNEKPVDLTNFQSWYNVKVFRTALDADKAVKSGAIYHQRKEMMENTATTTSGCVNHYDRKLGALIARLHGIGNSELKTLGLWESAILERHYTKYALPETVAKLSGFKDGQSYFISRAKADPMEFQEIHGGEALFSSFFPFLDDPTVFQSVLEQRTEGNNTCFNVYQTLHLIRLVFWQDLPHYFTLYPQLRIFKCASLTKNWGLFLKWCDFCNERTHQGEDACFRSQLTSTFPEEQSMNDQEALCWRKKIESSFNELKSLSAANAAKLDRLLHAVESHGAFGKRKRMDEEEFRRSLSNGGKHIIRKLRDLNDMTIQDIYEEWNVAVVSEGVEFCSLKEFERRRTDLKEEYRSEALKTAIARRRHLANFIDQTAKELGSLDRAFNWIEDLQVKLGQGKKCTLYRLWQHISNF